MSIIEKSNEWARKNPLKFILIAIIMIGVSMKIGSNIGSSLRSDVTNSTTNPNSTNRNNIVKESLTKSDCLRLYGTAPDMSASELAQAECMLQQNDYKTACDCMVILSK